MADNILKNPPHTTGWGNYIILNEIGRGSNGTVYKAIQQSTGQTVAIKTILAKEGNDEPGRLIQTSRFEREVRLCAELNHPNIVKIIDKGINENNEPFVVFEYVVGITLKEHIAQNRGLSAVEAAELMGQLLEALVCAHKNGIVHRDLKPHNMMVSNLDTKIHLKILDFGIGAFTNDALYRNGLTNESSNEFQGTPAYCAPEQLRGEAYSVKSDFYAWGLIFIECLTGKTVVEGNSIAEIVTWQLSPTEIIIPKPIRSHPLGKLLAKVLAKNHHHRPEHALAIHQELKRIVLSDIQDDFQADLWLTQPENEPTVVTPQMKCGANK